MKMVRGGRKYVWQDFVARRPDCHCWQQRDERKLSAMELLVIALIVALVVYGLNRNNKHNPERPHLHGSTDVKNMDTERVVTDLLARA